MAQSRSTRLVLAVVIPLLVTLWVWNDWEVERDACELFRRTTFTRTSIFEDCGAVDGDQIFPITLAVIVGGGIALSAFTSRGTEDKP